MATPVTGRVLLAVALLGIACGPANQSPVLDHIGDQVALVGTEVQVPLRASDPEGDRLSFTFTSPDASAFAKAVISPYGSDGSQAVFRWTPLAAQKGTHSIDFHVTDGSSTATETITIDVQDKNAPPRFVEPPMNAGTVLNLGTASCIDVNITVSDPDSARITIAVAPPVITGGELKQAAGAFTAVWHWCPSAAQQEASSDYLLNVTASDGANPAVPLSYRVLLVKPAPVNCPGTGPVVTHSPANVSTQANVTIKAHVTDDKGLGAAPVVYHRLTAPPTPVVLTGFTPLPMKLVSGTVADGEWTADIPNPVASMPASSVATIYYLLSATDNDDPTGSCDHTTRVPSSGSYQMTVTNPGGQGNLPPCQPCSADSQCGGTGDHCVFVGDGDYCGKGCQTDGECPTNYGCRGPLTSVGGASAKQCVPLSGSCALIVPPTCTDDSFEPNDTIAEASARPLLGAGTLYSEKSCPGATGGTDPDFYQIVLAADAQVTMRLAGGTTSDLNLQLLDKSGGELATSASAGSSETIDRCLPAGNYFFQVYASSVLAPAENSYTLTYSAVSKSCAAPTCQPDRLEPNDQNGTPVDLTSVQVSYQQTALTICAGDIDWFPVKLITGDTLRIAVVFPQTSAAQDLDLDVYDGDTALTACGLAGQPQCSAANGHSDDANEYYSFTTTHDGTYWVGVYGYAGAINTYDLCMSVLTGVCATGP